ncbi:cobalamin B12-binding domain-containing protein [Candidatus Bathyarchaeota archaeon]|nr:cobalamin B12-binding domain-containing protein [Candidatus Bathyarchaeota archaeon]
MRVTLINPPYPKGSPESIFIPLGITYLAAILEKNGYEVNVLDCQVLKPSREELEAKISQWQPQVIGVTASTLTYWPAVEIVKTVKEASSNCVTVMGGPHVTVLDEETLQQNPEVDVIVRGEGEYTLLELLKELSHGGNLSKILGITFRKDGEIIRNPDRPFIQNLDELPFPAFHHLSLKKYQVFGKNYLPIITSRGCPFQCTFCMAHKMCGRRFRARSPKNVVDELEILVNHYGADAVTFYDDTFTFDLKRVFEICREMKRRGVLPPWDCRTRVDMITKELLAEMRSANCQLIHFGVESGSPELLKAMKKGTTVEQNEKAIKMVKEAGMLVAVSVIIGYPGETAETLQQTMDFLRRTDPDYVYVCVPTPYPGTELYEHIKAMGWRLSSDWTRYDEQTLVFENPNFPAEKIAEARRKFYNRYFSPMYILRKSLRRDFYSRTMARIALNDFLWRLKFPTWLFRGFRKSRSQNSSR